MSAGQLEISLVHLSSSYAIDHGLWSDDETTCVHLYEIRKWHPLQWAAAGQCCEQLCQPGGICKL